MSQLPNCFWVFCQWLKLCFQFIHIFFNRRTEFKFLFYFKIFSVFVDNLYLMKISQLSECLAETKNEENIFYAQQNIRHCWNTLTGFCFLFEKSQIFLPNPPFSCKVLQRQINFMPVRYSDSVSAIAQYVESSSISIAACISFFGAYLGEKL